MPEAQRPDGAAEETLINGVAVTAGGCSHAAGSVSRASSPYWAGAPEQGDSFVDEGVDTVLVDVDGRPEAVAGACFEPFLHVVRGDGCRADRGGVVVDDPVGEDVAERPSFEGDFECFGGSGDQRNWVGLLLVGLA